MQRAASVAWAFSLSAEDPTFSERMTDRNGVRSVTVDGTAVFADSVTDEIARDKYERQIAAQEAVTGNAFGIRMRRQLPPGGGG